MRTLATPAQGRFTYATPEEAQRQIDNMLANNSEATLRSVYGFPLEVRACPCWPVHFDPKGVWFDLDSTSARISAAGRGGVNTTFVHPPIPVRGFDWCATFDNDEPDDNGNMLAGHGKTKAEAVAELLDRFEERKP